jgi:hypothetical protein
MPRLGSAKPPENVAFVCTTPLLLGKAMSCLFHTLPHFIRKKSPAITIADLSSLFTASRKIKSRSNALHQPTNENYAVTLEKKGLANLQPSQPRYTTTQDMSELYLQRCRASQVRGVRHVHSGWNVIQTSDEYAEAVNPCLRGRI